MKTTASRVALGVCLWCVLCHFSYVHAQTQPPQASAIAHTSTAIPDASLNSQEAVSSAPPLPTTQDSVTQREVLQAAIMVFDAGKNHVELMTKIGGIGGGLIAFFAAVAVFFGYREYSAMTGSVSKKLSEVERRHGEKLAEFEKNHEKKLAEVEKNHEEMLCAAAKKFDLRLSSDINALMKLLYAMSSISDADLCDRRCSSLGRRLGSVQNAEKSTIEEEITDLRVRRKESLDAAKSHLTTAVEDQAIDTRLLSWIHGNLAYVQKRLQEYSQALQSIQVAIEQDKHVGRPNPERLYNAACYASLSSHFDIATQYIAELQAIKVEYIRDLENDEDMKAYWDWKTIAHGTR